MLLAVGKHVQDTCLDCLAAGALIIRTHNVAKVVDRPLLSTVGAAVSIFTGNGPFCDGQIRASGAILLISFTKRTGFERSAGFQASLRLEIEEVAGVIDEDHLSVAFAVDPGADQIEESGIVRISGLRLDQYMWPVRAPDNTLRRMRDDDA